VIAATRSGAIDGLRRALVGFGVERVELFAVRPPLTREQVAAVHAANDEMDQMKRAAGIYGEGTARERAIEEWLTTETQRAQR